MGGRIVIAFLGAFSALSLQAQEKIVSVPFVGCKGDGQLGPLEAPQGTTVPVAIDAEAAGQLAFYRGGLHVLAPRAWHCFGFLGSSGYVFFVSPQPIDTTKVLSDGFTGPAIEVSFSYGQGSGAFEVAEVIARAFPSSNAFVVNLKNLLQLPESEFASGPYPDDVLRYQSKTVVEYITPAQKNGLGTDSRLKMNGSPIEGVAILTGEIPHLMRLAVRLPPELSPLTAAIIREFEADTKAHPPE